ncbi:MAG TPA: hypothetical protein VLS89_06180, partial [Candidatus Nanopelagicales bacterium]|nr:hypothetical protein [Candidatus Nanopelagicales bacterium]
AASEPAAAAAPRPALAAAPRLAVATAPEPAPTREAEQAEPGDSAEEGTTTPSRAAGGKPKRELPPYLRVIK